MKNVFWIFTVCMSIGIYSCSSNSAEKVVNEEEVTVIENENDNIVIETMDNLSEDLLADNNTDETPASEEEKETPEAKQAKVAKTDAKKKPKSSVKSELPTVSTPKAEAKPVKIATTPIKATPKPQKPVAKPVKTSPEKVVEATKTAPKSQLDHSAWDKMLRKNVSSTGVVNYAGFKAQKSDLEAYLKHLKEFSPQSGWSKDKKLAYWINIYNAWTVKTIVDNHPIASITKIDGGKPWKTKKVKSGSNTYSLDEVENTIIRPRFKDGRIHFAVNCAAKSCPPLMNKAWTASNVNSNMEKMTKTFVNNTAFNTISAKKIKISKIFEWYAADFGDLITFLNKYSNTKIDADAKVEYIEYDWDLNGK
jgi:hypothetical protein